MNQAGIRINAIWPILILAVSGLWFFQNLNGLPPSVADLLQRGLPALLVVVGLMLLLGRRLRFGNLVALILTAVLLGAVVTAAYARQAGILREDYAAPFERLLDPNVTTLRLIIATRLTQIDVQRAVPGDRTLRSQYLGSLESDVTTAYTVDGNTATFTLTELPRSSIPSLLLVGRGKLTVNLPAGVTIEELRITGEGGDLTLDSSNIGINALAVNLRSGSITALLAAESGLIGDIKTDSGTVSMTIPPEISTQIALRGGGAGSPTFDSTRYTLSRDNVLEPKSGTTQAQITIDAPGQITIQ